MSKHCVKQVPVYGSLRFYVTNLRLCWEGFPQVVFWRSVLAVGNAKKSFLTIFRLFNAPGRRQKTWVRTWHNFLDPGPRDRAGLLGAWPVRNFEMRSLTRWTTGVRNWTTIMFLDKNEYFLPKFLIFRKYLRTRSGGGMIQMRSIQIQIVFI